MKVLIAIVLFFSLPLMAGQPEPTFELRGLTIQDIQLLYQVVDDSELPGKIRKPLLEKIGGQYNAQIKAMEDAKKKTDTTKTKPGKN